MEETSVGTIHISPHERLKKYALKDIDELYNDFHIKEGGLTQEQIEQMRNSMAAIMSAILYKPILFFSV